MIALGWFVFGVGAGRTYAWARDKTEAPRWGAILLAVFWPWLALIDGLDRSRKWLAQ